MRDNEDQGHLQAGTAFMQAVKNYLITPKNGGEPAYRKFKETMRASLFKLKGEARRPQPETAEALAALREIKRMLEAPTLRALAGGLTSMLPAALQDSWAKVLAGEL